MSSQTPKINLVVIPFHDWKKCEEEGFRTRDAHLILEFAKRPEINQILVIDRPISFPEMVIKRRKWKVSQGDILYQRMNIQLTRVAPKIAVLDILSFRDLIVPIILGKRWWAEVFKRESIHSMIREAIHYLHMDNYGLLAFTPLAFGVINRIGEDYRLFFAVDNWLTHPQMKQVIHEVEIGYREFSASSNIVITTSSSLNKIFEPKNDNVYFIPNGVNPALFTDNTTLIPPRDIADIEHPIVGYAGKIQERIDISLVQNIIKKLPDVNFVFIGPMMAPKHFDSLKNFSNFHYLGDKQYEQLPIYLSQFDVCIIPHVVSNFTESMSPLKLFEYLAANKPVVTTSSSGLKIDSEWLITTSNPDLFAQGIQNFLLHRKNERFIIPNEWTWKSRAEQVLSLIQTIVLKQ